ncbi:PLC-like phosphodiesterase [Aspergillus californicus]
MRDQRDASGTMSKFPQAIAHRGYKAAFAENTMAAFRGAVEVGAQAIETDVHLSKDGVVVIAHDASLKRTFGVPRKVADCDWEYLSMLRTVGKAQEPMARLSDLLSYLAEPGSEHMWLLLDIKMHDDPNLLCPAIARTIASIPTTGRPWNERIILASWKAEWVSACLRHIPGFPMALTAFSPPYATAMLEALPDLNFSLFNHGFATRRGSRFRKRAREQSGMIFSWTDNADEWMALSIRNQVDGVITDDPKRFMELCSHWEGKGESKAVREKASQSTIRQSILWAILNLLVRILEFVSVVTKGSQRSQVKKALAV